MTTALPIEPSRRGACPSLHAPMQTGDGLLARVRVAGGRLTPAQLAGIAELAQQHGNGLIEISARGNLQVRGLTQAAVPSFAQSIEAIVEIERGLVVQTPPLAGDDPRELADPWPIAAAIRVAAASLADRLGPKVSVVVDGGGQIGLGNLNTDIRLVAKGPGDWTLSVAGRMPVPVIRHDEVSATLRILRQIAALGPAARASDLPGSTTKILADASRPVGVFALMHGQATGIALPFGSASAATLVALANQAALHGVGEFRLAPHHALLAIGADPSFPSMAETLGFITKTDDPRQRISACIGSEGCASGHVPARLIAAQLAANLPQDQHLHVSGCSKGCAHPRASDITLVGRADGYGLVIDGRAGDTPRAVLQADNLASALGQG
ncbi:MAG: precorrin-3B synthase [Candidatus Devosia phytovorans]|uniref:Precorrin-3B synthase n=1 Tax=Candidatus Devosia phytovorans TaxID=3121372 RepID=A0AAJ6AYM0_9HYPH|nr:precorrin-3B synthase [Devosia sp.]WEK02871.1 MAG: precorrin-3B synthase [Devosia sp.]